jgi:hypothetical protein
MGRQTNIKIVGTHGTTIYYKMNDGFFMRSRPKKNKQTKSTKQAAVCFGLAQSTAGILRAAFAGLMANYTTFDNKNKLAQPINKWILAGGLNTTSAINIIPKLTGYEFNSKSPLSARWKVNLSVMRADDGMLQLTIPAYNPVEKIITPAGTKQIAIHMAAAGCTVKDRQLNGMHSTKLTVNYTNELIPAQPLQFPVCTAAGNLTIVYVTMRYIVIKKNREKIANEKAWVPGAIISALFN